MYMYMFVKVIFYVCTLLCIFSMRILTLKEVFRNIKYEFVERHRPKNSAYRLLRRISSFFNIRKTEKFAIVYY